MRRAEQVTHAQNLESKIWRECDGEIEQGPDPEIQDFEIDPEIGGEV